MSTAVAMPLVKHANASAPSTPAASPTAVEFHYTQDENFVAVLHKLGARW